MNSATTYNFTPPPHAPSAREFLVTLEKTDAGTATVSVNQRGGDFTNLSSAALDFAGTKTVREVITASTLADISVDIDAISAGNVVGFIEQVGYPEGK